MSARHTCVHPQCGFKSGLHFVLCRTFKRCMFCSVSLILHVWVDQSLFFPPSLTNSCSFLARVVLAKHVAGQFIKIQAIVHSWENLCFLHDFSNGIALLLYWLLFYFLFILFFMVKKVKFKLSVLNTYVQLLLFQKDNCNIFHETHQWYNLTMKSRCIIFISLLIYLLNWYKSLHTVHENA